MTSKIVAVTPAGRKAYLEVLKTYILRDDTIHEWQLWDNCRNESDRAYIEELASSNPKIRLIRRDGVDGTNRSLNQFYRNLSDPDAFYIKLDDDVVYLPDAFGRALLERAAEEKGRYTYWSPMVINNPLCSWLLKYHSEVVIAAPLTASALCTFGWRSPYFAEELHRKFCTALERGTVAKFKTPSFDISLSRFSINCIGVFGDMVCSLGEQFCPLNVDDEDWISAVLPTRLGKPGRLLGDLAVAHFAFFTQEEELLDSGVLEEYYRVAGLQERFLRPARRKMSLQARLKRHCELRWFSGPKTIQIGI